MKFLRSENAGGMGVFSHVYVSICLCLPHDGSEVHIVILLIKLNVRSN